MNLARFLYRKSRRRNQKNQLLLASGRAPARGGDFGPDATSYLQRVNLHGDLPWRFQAPTDCGFNSLEDICGIIASAASPHTPAGTFRIRTYLPLTFLSRSTFFSTIEPPQYSHFSSSQNPILAPSLIFFWVSLVLSGPERGESRQAFGVRTRPPQVTFGPDEMLKSV